MQSRDSVEKSTANMQSTSVEAQECEPLLYRISHTYGTYGFTLSVGQCLVMQESLIRQGIIMDPGNHHIQSSVFLRHYATSRCAFTSMLETGQRPKETH